MEREKRQKKIPQVYVIPKACYPRIRSKIPKKRLPKRAQYQVIPAPMKFSCIANFFPLYGDIGLRIGQGTLYMDARNLNQFLDVRGIEVTKEHDFRKINLTVDKKAQAFLPAWQHLVEGLLRSDSNELREWGTRIKNFSLSYEETKRGLSRNEVIFNGRNKKEFIEITEKTERKISKLFQKYPCLFFKPISDKDSTRLKEICFNEQYLNELGYSLDSFATTIFQEGIPRMMPNNTVCASKMFLDNYYALGKEGIETPEIISDLMMKNGYLRRVRYKILYLPSYKDKAYDVTGVVILLGRENSIAGSIDETEGICEVDKTFLERIIQKEKRMDNFMKTFYDITLNLPHINSHKVCRIRELNIVKNEDKLEEEWINKKEEDLCSLKEY